MHKVPDEDLDALIAAPNLYKMLVLGDGDRKKTIATTADSVVPNGNLPDGTVTRSVIWVTSAAALAAVQQKFNLPSVPPTPDIITVCTDGSKCAQVNDNDPDDLTDPIILNAYFTQAVALCP